MGVVVGGYFYPNDTVAMTHLSETESVVIVAMGLL